MSQRQGSGGIALPRWAYRVLWALHRAGYAVSGGRLGLRSASDDRLGTLRLRTIGRRSGEERATMLYYLPAGDAAAVVASNAGSPSPPAWWLNLQAQPRAEIDLPAGPQRVQAREATGEERAALWSRFVDQLADYERYAAHARRDIPIVILEPVDDDGEAGEAGQASQASQAGGGADA